MSMPLVAMPPRERAVRRALLAPFRPYVMRGLIAANLAVFLWGVSLGRGHGIGLTEFVQPSGRKEVIDILHATGSLQATDLLAPGWGYLRLLACCFVHFGIIHLGVNMFSLYLIGPLLERMWGHARFLALYLIAGFGGSCVAVTLRPMAGNVPVSLAGASGAFWGLLAAMAVWVGLNCRYLPRRLLLIWAVNLVIAFAVNVGLTYAVPGISAEGHYGGAATGTVCALLLHVTRFGPWGLRAAAFVALAALPVLGLFAVAHYVPRAAGGLALAPWCHMF
jgi:membrane associated rhomboid family serine protease